MEQYLGLFRQVAGCFLITLQLQCGRESGSQFEKEGNQISEKLREFLSRSFELIQDSSRRKGPGDLGYYHVWGGAIFVHLSVGAEEYKIALLQAIGEFAKENEYHVKQTGDNLAIIFPPL